MLRDTTILEQATDADLRRLARVEADRVVAMVAALAYRDGTSVYEIGCGDGDLLVQLASRLSVAQRAGRFVGVEERDAWLSRAETQLRPWLSEHEINLLAALPANFHHASVVIVNEADKAVSESCRRHALAMAGKDLLPGGVLIHLCPAKCSPATVLAASFARVETLMAWRDFGVVAAWTAVD